ncbi:Protein O-mannosyltransferase 2 [Coemansia sp. RSA 2050]|nr:Protein O-mannosyltransferase 2 [Coemansia sp. RSA 2050]KAJ2736372.1 Protein O-mannosyltransferase 2 [Coemansia sp. BCRC 34962]
MESRILKQRGRHNAGSANTLQFTADYAAGEPNNDGKHSAHAMSAHGEGSSSKTYGAYPVGPTAQRDNGGIGNSYETVTDFSAASFSEGILGIMRSKDLVTVMVLTLLSMMTRLYRIGRSNRISWDESHFTYFGAKYLNHSFYHDVHPPLAKMLVALAQTLAGFNGSYDLKSNRNYPDFMNYTLMRVQISMYGIALVPLAYLTCLQLRMSRPMATLAATFVLFDNAICVMSRFILLDEQLLFFTALTLLSAATFQNISKYVEPFSSRWWVWLVMTGFSLGCVISSKWIGLFCVILVGIVTAEDLFRKFCDRVPLEDYIMHWLTRINGLIVLPLVIYMACFWIHFKILYRTGSGEHKMSSNFQARLLGSKLNSQPYDITYGAFVDLRSMYNGPGLLHSHYHVYPSMSRQQQVTCFPHRDTNNVWQLQKARGIEANYTLDKIEFVGHGDIVQLMHNKTGAVLRSSKQFLAPLTTSHFEVAAENITDSSDSGISDWRVEVVRQGHSKRSDKRLHAMTTVFRLRHVSMGCLLRVGSRRLPKWGWGQSEVTCLPDATHKKDVKSNDVLWYIEHNTNTRMLKSDLSKYVKGDFFVDLIQLNIEMGKTNSGLSPDRDKYNALESDPWSWPFLVYPMRMVGWGDKAIKYYEIGNPILWWASAIVCVMYPFRLVYWLARQRRQCNDWRAGELLEFWDNSKLLWGGWALHYFPFFLMGRVTYIHHYLPALYFALLQLAFDLDFFFGNWRRGRYLHLAAWCIGTLVCLVFLYFSPFTYGWDRPAKALAGRKWLSTWNVYEDFYAM